MPFHALPGRSQEVDLATKGFLQPKRDRHRQVERERDRRLALRNEEFAWEPAPAEALVERHQARLADQQAEINIALLSKEIERPLDRRGGKPSPPKGGCVFTPPMPTIFTARSFHRASRRMTPT